MTKWTHGYTIFSLFLIAAGGCIGDMLLVKQTARLERQVTRYFTASNSIHQDTTKALGAVHKSIGLLSGIEDIETPSRLFIDRTLILRDGFDGQKLTIGRNDLPDGGVIEDNIKMRMASDWPQHEDDDSITFVFQGVKWIEIERTLKGEPRRFDED